MQCDGCGRQGIIEDSVTREIYCQYCGRVVEEAIDYSPFWLKEGGPVYERASILEVNQGLGTPLSSGLPSYSMLQRLHADQVFASRIERSYAAALPSLDVIWSIWRLSQGAREESALLYRRCVRKGLTRGREASAMSAAVVWLACEEYGIKRNVPELAGVIGIEAREAEAHIRAIRREIYGMHSEDKVSELVRKGIEDLGLSDEVRSKAKELTDYVLAHKIGFRKKPGVVAAAIIDAVSVDKEEKIDRYKIAEALGVSERSVRRFSSELV